MTELVAALAILTVHNLGIERLPAALYVPACLGTASALVGLAGAAGLSGPNLGLSRSGLGVGAAVAAVVALLVVVAGRLPATRPAFADRRMEGVGPLGTAYRALVRIPLGTVAVEEIAFRGVLLALLDRHVSTQAAIAGTCLLFGLWHLVPAAATLRTNRRPVTAAPLAAAVAATTLAGVGFCWLRLSTGGLAAPAMVHASMAATATVVAYRLRVRTERGRTPARPS